MNEYIEIFALQNLLLDYLIAVTSYRFLRLGKSACRLWLAAVTGSLFSVFYPFISAHAAVGIVYKVATSVIMCLVLYIGKCKFLKGFTVFYITSFVYGGGVLAVALLRYGNYADAVSKPCSVGAVAVGTAALFLYTAIRKMSVAYHRRSDAQGYVYGYSITLGDIVSEGKGFMDTGNRLYDSVTGLPVVVIGIGTLAKLLPDSDFADIVTGHADRVFEGARKMSCKSIGGTSDMWIVKPKKFEVYLSGDEHILYDVMVGLSFSSVTGGEQYDAILHPALTEVN